MRKSTFINQILFFIIIFTACKKENEIPKPETQNQYLISAQPRKPISLVELKIAYAAIGQIADIEKIKYEVTPYYIAYKTSFRDSSIQASGIIYLPKGFSGPMSLLSFEHGTSFRKKDAPSAITGFQGYELFAALGYAVFVPDFIGYGASSSIFHPYYDQKHSALAVIDLFKAGKEFMRNSSLSYNEKVFILGYSEGGYVAMAAAKEIQQNPAHDLKLTAVAAGAGGFDLENMLSYVADTNYFAYPSYLTFVLASYNNVYRWNKPYNYFFKDKFAFTLSSLLDGTKDGSEINNYLSTNLDSLFNPDFYSNLKANGELELKTAFINNSVSNWKPDFPLRLYHGTADEIVPFRNTESTFKKIKDNGSLDVEFLSIQDGTHTSSFIPMLQSVVPWLERYNK